MKNYQRFVMTMLCLRNCKIAKRKLKELLELNEKLDEVEENEINKSSTIEKPN